MKRGVVLALLGASFLIFVAGSFVFAYMFVFSTAPSSPESGLPTVPVVGRSGTLPSPPSGSGDKVVPTAVVPQLEDRRRINFLLLGIDQRDDEKGVPTRSDTMIVLSLDEVNKRAAMISLPRDMWVQIPGHADNRINVANFLGDAEKLPGGGPALAKKTVEYNFGIKIDYTARVDFRSFEKIIDTLGGVTVNVEQAIKDDEYPTEDYHTMSIYIPAGVQHMDGKVALQYARSRHSENDFGRAKRQQTLLLAVRDRAMQLDVIPKLPTLIGTLFDMVQTDVPATEFLRLAALVKDIGASNVSSLVIDEKLAPPFKGEGGADLLAPDKPAIRKAIGALLADPIVQRESATIEVSNGSGKANLATRIGEYLTAQGFDVENVTSAERADYKTTQIQLMGSKKGTAGLLAEALDLSPQTVVSRPASSMGPDIRVIVGQDVNFP